MTGLREMIQRELARREEGDGKWPVLTFVVHDEPGAMTDAAEAAKAIIAEADAREAGGPTRRITVTRAIAEAVIAILRTTHPRRYILTHPIIDSKLRHAPIPDVQPSEGKLSPAASDTRSFYEQNRMRASVEAIRHDEKGYRIGPRPPSAFPRQLRHVPGRPRGATHMSD